ncbi:TorF family putative porin [Pseudomonas sp. PB3P13]
MKYALIGGLAAVCLPFVNANAVELSEDFSLIGNVGLFSEYNSRGLSQTQHDPSLQLYAMLLHSSGFYVASWSSNVDFGRGSKARYETDYIGGYLWQPAEKVIVDVGYLKYTYPKQSNLNVSEKYLTLDAYGFLFGAYYSDDNYGDQTALYSYVGYKTMLPFDVGAQLKYGRSDFKDPTFFNSRGQSKESYRSWEFQLSKSYLDLNWTATLVGTDLSKSECSSYLGYEDVCSNQVVFGVSKDF